jgi:RNA polymerase II subunit A-like phosphatase
MNIPFYHFPSLLSLFQLCHNNPNMDLDAEPSPATPIHLPPSLPYPITISSLLPTQQVSRGQTVLWYSYTLKDDFSKDASTATINSTGGKQNKEKGREEKGYSTWECTLDGELVRWGEGVTAGVVLTDSRSVRLGSFLFSSPLLVADDQYRDRNPIAYIQQPCDHPVQFHGMCAVCGIDLAGYVRRFSPPYWNSLPRISSIRH